MIQSENSDAMQDRTTSSVNVTGTDRKIANWLTHPVFPVRSSYYRAALMPVIRKAMERIKEARADAHRI